MKKCLGLVVVAGLIHGVTTVSAGTLGVIATPEGGFPVEDLSRVSIGVTYQNQEREIRLENGLADTLEVPQTLAHVGVDLFEFLSVSASMGLSDPELSDGTKFEDLTDVFGFGLRVSLLEHDVTGPEALAGRWNVFVEAQMLFYENDDEPYDWREIFYDVQVRYQLFAFDMGEDETRCPYSLTLYAGFAYSDINGEFESRQHVGAIGGADLYVTRNLAIGGELQFFEEETWAGKLTYHF